MRLISKFMSEKGLNKETQNRIKKYLEFYLGKENAMRTEGNDVMHFLSESLKDELVKEVNAKILDDCRFFSINFRKKFLYSVSHLLVEQSYGPEEFVFKYEEADNQAVYFITSGKVLMLFEKCNFKVKKLGKNDNFGAIEFFSGQPRMISAKSLEFSTVFVLTRKVFTERLQEYPLDKESYQQIYDSINIYGTYKYLDIPCLACGKLDHMILHCPSTHSKMNKQKVIHNFLREEKNFRRKFVRKNIRKFHYEKDYEIIQEAITRIQIDHQDELNEIDHAAEYYEDEEDEDFISDHEEILDRNMYSTPQIIYNDEFGAERIFEPDKNKHWKRKNYRKPTITKGDKRKADEVDLFIQKNYNPLYQNINIDMVWNFELYYPNNNINKIARDLEKERFKKLLRMRVGDKADRMFPLLSKAFRLFEHRRPEEKYDKVASPMKKGKNLMKLSGPRRDSKFQFRIPEPLSEYREGSGIRSNIISNHPSMAELSLREGTNSRIIESKLIEGKIIDIKPSSGYFTEADSPNIVSPERRKSRFFQQDTNRVNTQSAVPSSQQTSTIIPLNLHLQRVVNSSHIHARKLSVFSRRSNKEQNLSSSSSDSDQTFSEINNSFIEQQKPTPVIPLRARLDRKRSLNSRKMSTVLDDSFMMNNSFRRVEGDGGARKLKFEHANVMEKFTQKLSENKTLQTEHLQTGNYLTTENGFSNTMLYRIPVRLTSKAADARKKIFEAPDLARKILLEKLKDRPKRSISVDDHKSVTKTLDDLNIEKVMNLRR